MTTLEPVPTTHEVCSCGDYAQSRRSFLKTALATSAGAIGVSMFGDTFRQVAYGGTRDTNVLVVLSLRGGADSLSIVVPYAEDAYYAARPGIAIPPKPLLHTDGTFGLHPALKPVSWLWDGGRMAAVVATGLPVPNRSHFAAMEAVEDADPASSERQGWINRLIGLDTERRPHEAVALGAGVVPTSMWGPNATLSARKVDALDLPGAKDPEARARKRRSLGQVWADVPGPLGTGARTTLQATETMNDIATTPYRPKVGASYPGGQLGNAMKDTARLLKAKLGVEVVTIDHGSWDMHNHLGTVATTGAVSMTGKLTELAKSVDAFFSDLGTLGSKVTVVTVTEFGRRVTENGNGGLDHGWANAMLLFGAGVNGGYHGRWPGLGPSAMVDGDLAVRTDYRSVLAEILSRRFNASIPQVFPGFQPQSVGVMR